MIQDHKNSLWLAIQYSISLILSLLGLKLNLLSFGKEGFSIWILLLSIWGIGSALDLGFGISSVKFIAQYKHDKSLLSKIISTSLFIYVTLGLIISLLVFIISQYVYFNNPKLFSIETLVYNKKVFYLLGINFYLQYITVIFRAIFDGHSNFVVSSKIALFSSFFIFLSTLFIYFFKLDILFLSFLCIAVSIIQLLVYLYFTKKYYPYVKIVFRNISFSTLKMIFSFSLSIQVTFFLGSLIDPLIKYILGNFGDKTSIPTYEIARKFALAVSGLFSFAFKNALPKTTTLHSEHDFQHFFYSYSIKLSDYGILFSGLFYGCFAFVFTFIFSFFYNNEQCMIIFLLLALSEIINNMGYSFYVLIMGMGKALFLSILQFSNIFLITVFLILGYHYFNNFSGLSGYLLSGLLGNVFMILFLKKSIRINVAAVYLRKNMYKLCVFLSFTICNVIYLFFYPKNILFSQIIFSLLCFLIFFKDIANYYSATVTLLYNKFRQNKT